MSKNPTKKPQSRKIPYKPCHSKTNQKQSQNIEKMSKLKNKTKKYLHVVMKRLL